MPGLPHSHFPVAAAPDGRHVGGAAARRGRWPAFPLGVRESVRPTSDRRRVGPQRRRLDAGRPRRLHGLLRGCSTTRATSRPDGPVRGAAAVRAMYAARFRPGGRGMGRLSTELLDVRHLGVDYALVDRALPLGAHGGGGRGGARRLHARVPARPVGLEDHLGSHLVTQAARSQAGSGPPPIGAAVRDRRRRLGLTLQAVAVRAGLSAPFISQVERGLASPSITSLIGIAAALGVDIDYFVGVPRPGQIVRRGSAPDLLTLDSPIIYQRLSGSHAERKMEALLMVVPSGAEAAPTRREGEGLLVRARGRTDDDRGSG